MPIGPPVPANIPIVPWPEENLSQNSKPRLLRVQQKFMDAEIYVMKVPW